jgi:hypothetical protein
MHLINLKNIDKRNSNLYLTIVCFFCILKFIFVQRLTQHKQFTLTEGAKNGNYPCENKRSTEMV